MKANILTSLIESGVVAVIRATSTKEAIDIAKACIKGGIKSLEITFTVPDAHLVLKSLSEDPTLKDAYLGAGTVMDQKTCLMAIEHGARYIVSPSFNEDVLNLCQAHDLPYIPGCLTPTEITHALSKGVELIKLFPGSAFGPSYIKALKGPMPNLNIMPTGGVSIDNVGEWISNGACAVGVGSDLTKPAKTGNFDDITQLAKAYIQRVTQARK